MEYNIDILVAGCNTTCMHCYVNGGKAPSMELEDFKYCMEKLNAVFSHFGEKVSFTLDNELYNHPNAKEILELVENNYSKNYYHHGSTTGIAILEHPDREEILKILKRNNWLDVSFAIHGGKEAHNKIVNNSEAMDAVIEASRLFKENGFDVWISLMISKKFIEDLSEVAELLDAIRYDHILPVIPDFYPNGRLIKYQNIRCNKNEYDKVFAFLQERKIEAEEIKNAVEQYDEANVLQKIKYDAVKDALLEKETAFFHVNQKLDFYVGNTGSALKYCGNLKECSSEEIIDWIENSNDNFYETATIHCQDILEAVSEGKLVRSEENYVYPNVIAAILAMIQNGKEILK